MKTSKFTEPQIIYALRQAEAGTKVAEVCRKMGISEATGETTSPHTIGGRSMEGSAPLSSVASSNMKPRTGS
jgi:putative transposase